MSNGNDLTVSQSVIEETCGETPLPRMGTIEQVWETDPIPAEEIEDRAAETVQSLSFADVPEGGSVALGVGDSVAVAVGVSVAVASPAVVDSLSEDWHPASATAALARRGRRGIGTRPSRRAVIL